MDDMAGTDRTKSRCREDNLKYAALFDQSPDGIVIIDTEGNFLDFNTAAHRSLGYSREEFAKLRLQDIDPEGPEEIKRSILQVLDEGRAEFEVTHRTRDGELRYVHVITQAISLSGRQILHTIWHDVTERKKTEDALREANTRLETLIQAMPDIVILKDAGGRYMVVNRALEESFGWKQDQFIGRTNNELLPPDIAEMCNRSDAEAIRSGRPIHAEERSFDGVGRVQFLDTIKAPIYDRSGDLAGLVCVARDVTARKKAEEALQRSEDKFRTLFESATDGLFIIDTEGYLVDVNKTACERLGYTKEEMLSMHISRFVHPDFRGKIPERIEHLQKYGWCICESAHLGKNGTVMPVEINAKAMDFNGKQVFFSVNRDITGRKKAEEALRQSEERFRLAMRGANDGVWDWDLKTGKVYYSPRWKAMLGYAEGELESNLETWKQLVHPDDREPTLAAVGEFLEGRADKYEVEFRMRYKDGRYRDILSRAFLVHDAQGVPVRLVGTHVDITERKRIEEALRRNEEFMRNVLDNVDEGFLVIDRDFRIITANKAYGVWSGKRRDEMRGRYCYEISHQTLRPCYEEGEDCAVKRAFETGEPCIAMHRHSDAKGNILYVETRAFPLRDASGAVTSAIETIHNITERHLLEAELLKTQKLEAIGKLAGGIAHDFNNLLQGVFGYISLAKLSAGQPERSLAALEGAEKALHMSISLTNQLLTFSKGGRPVRKPVHLRNAIENAAKFALSGSRSECRILIADDLWPVEADEGQIGQVIQNIALNADQAMPEGGRVEIWAANEEIPKGTNPLLPAGGRFVKIVIRDSGMGIPHQHLQKIFDPYFTTKQKGSGLGLATTYSVIRNHGGVINVSSEVGRGSVFSIYLFACDEKAETLPPPNAATGRTGKVLVLDDEETVRLVVAQMLESLGHEVVLAKDGEDAIEKYSRARRSGAAFDVVILDLTVRGGMGGEETVRNLSEIDHRVKAVVSSGYSDDPVVSDYRAHGFAASLNKPYTIDALRECLEILLAPDRSPE
jgi:two-component system cell cycle sensor histidine kinase/response regulator CckA